METDRRRRVIVTAAMLAGMFLTAIDMTAVSTAMPAIVGALGGLPLYAWVFSIYMLASTATLPLFGHLSDRFGRKPLYLLGVAIFVSGSVLCSTSTSMAQLIVFRGLQGIGAGAVIPITMTIIGELYDLERRAKMQAWFSGVWGISSIAGPLVGGALVDLWSWRAIFYLNVPFGFVAALLVAVSFQDTGERKRDAALNVGSLAGLTVGVAALLVALAEGGRSLPWTSPGLAALLALTAVGLGIFIHRDRRSEDPVLPRELLRDRMFAVCIMSGVFAGAALFGLVAYLPLFVQGVLGASATTAGSSLVPLTLGWVVSSIIAGRLILRIGYRTVVLAGLVAFATGTIWLTALDSSSPIESAIAWLVLCGIGLGSSMTTMLIAVQSGVPRRLLGTATAAIPFTRNIGGAIGVALAGAAMIRTVGGGGSSIQAAVGAEGPGLVALETGLHSAFVVIAVFACGALVAGLPVPRGRAQDLARRRL